ncbi:MAG: 3-oxoacyl-[acyl-carrier-protein] reductase [Proteobacteria bacterium]|nr:3-oxoacyl-[acyl-carrier-protein] reductase [Pseudomonadota bacterium]
MNQTPPLWTTEPQTLAGKRFFITGGSRGIGAAIAQLLAERGAQVAITYAQSKSAAEGLISKLPGSGHLSLQLELTDEDSINTAVEEAFKHWDQVDGVVNNAGLTKDGLLLRMKTEDFDRVIGANLRGCFLVTRAFLKPMLKARKGSIVNVTAASGQMGNAGQANYAASKAGIEAFSKSVAQEVASRQIRVNCVAPGFIQTEMTGILNDEQKSQILCKIPMERIAEPREVAQAVAFLLSDDSKYITGHTLSVNGGMLMR